MKKLIVFVALALLAHAAPAPVVLISLDGFRWDYCARYPEIGRVHV